MNRGKLEITYLCIYNSNIRHQYDLKCFINCLLLYLNIKLTINWYNYFIMNNNFLKLIGFKFQKSLHVTLKKISFSHSAVSLKNKCGSKGPPWRIMFFGNDDFSVKSLQILTSKM